MVEAPKVYCPKEGRDVPIWWCLGSSFRERSLVRSWLRLR